MSSTNPTHAQRCTQPVVELRQEAGAFTYGIRAPRARGVVPPVSFIEGGFSSLSACLLHVARGLAGNFPRIYVRFEDACVGEQDIVDLQARPEHVAGLLEARLRAARAAPQASHQAPAVESLPV
ncbi:hypothetical protein QTH87_21015 [Variovorax sp. J22P168]|uniref:hypothetical protein n=1 Tax=Variovorax jilinensis TaxID=3053513 RepID=UPI002578B680|nr:hypothetical protein [Variovorax sp. J22P168]MDM0014939.1 hypothetical protein [Variovorax sp. J22P168]